MNYPRPVNRIHQIEITSRCNLRCQYCVHPHMKREKLDMDMETLEKALHLAGRCVVERGQVELNMCGIGESLMHPQFEEVFDMARGMLPDITIVIATNGILLNDERAEILLRNKIVTFISLHRPEKAGLAVEVAKKHNIFFGVSNDPSTAAIDWAGKVDWFVSAATKELPCPWLENGQAMVCSDGRITTCCLDGDGEGIVGTVNTPLEELFIEPYSLCEDCHHNVP